MTAAVTTPTQSLDGSIVGNLEGTQHKSRPLSLRRDSQDGSVSSRSAGDNGPDHAQTSTGSQDPALPSLPPLDIGAAVSSSRTAPKITDLTLSRSQASPPSPSLQTARPKVQNAKQSPPAAVVLGQSANFPQRDSTDPDAEHRLPQSRKSAMASLQEAASSAQQRSGSTTSPTCSAASPRSMAPATPFKSSTSIANMHAEHNSSADAATQFPLASPSESLGRTATVSSPSRPRLTGNPTSPTFDHAARVRAQSSATIADLRRQRSANVLEYTSLETAALQADANAHIESQRRTRRMSTQTVGATGGPNSLLLQPAQEQVLARERIARGIGGIEAKVVILGAQGVGKTSLVHRYTSGLFSPTSVPSTIGASFLTKKLVVNGVKCRLQIWDTAGQERFRSMAPMYYRGSHAAIIVYDITSADSFADVKSWIEELKHNMGEDFILHIVGAKLDLAPFAREVDREEAREQVLRWVCPEREAAALAAQEAQRQQRPSSLAKTTPTSPSSTPSLSRSNTASKLSTLGSLAIGSASRLGVGFSSSTPAGSTQQTSKRSPATPVKQGSSLAMTPSNSSQGEGRSTSGSSGSEGLAATNSATPGDQSQSFELPGDDLRIEITEVSAKDDDGIEDVFVAVTERLVEKKAELEEQRLARERHSIFLHDQEQDDDDETPRAGAPKSAASTWSCC